MYEWIFKCLMMFSTSRLYVSSTYVNMDFSNLPPRLALVNKVSHANTVCDKDPAASSKITRTVSRTNDRCVHYEDLNTIRSGRSAYKLLY